MNKKLNLLFLPIILLATSCAQKVEMTSEEINALYAKSETAEINTMELKSSVNLKINAKGGGITLNGSLASSESYQIDLRNDTTIVKGNYSAKATGINSILSDIDGDVSGEMYYNGTTMYGKETSGSETDKFCHPESDFDFTEIVDGVMDMMGIAPVTVKKIRTLAVPTIVKNGEIHTFTYNLTKALEDYYKEDMGGGLKSCSAKATISLNADGLLTQEVLTLKANAVNPENLDQTVTIEFKAKIDIAYNKDLKITPLANLDSYCK